MLIGHVNQADKPQDMLLDSLLAIEHTEYTHAMKAAQNTMTNQL